jgi:hypothetical protein
MFKKRGAVVVDEGLQLIENYQRAIVQAHDQKADWGVSAAEIERERPAVVALAKAVTDRMREEYLSRRSGA